MSPGREGEKGSAPSDSSKGAMVPGRSFLPPSGTAVVGLCLCRGPSAVFWIVRPVIVDSVECVAVWYWSHVGKESREVLPTFADRDASTAVVGILRRGRAEAPRPHALPHGVRLGFVGLSVRAVDAADLLAPEAPAALRMPRDEMRP